MHLNGVPYFVQPPLYFWFGAAFCVALGPDARSHCVFRRRSRRSLSPAFTGYAVARQAGTRVGIYAARHSFDVPDAGRHRTPRDHGRAARSDRRDDDLLVVSRHWRRGRGALCGLRMGCRGGRFSCQGSRGAGRRAARDLSFLFLEPPLESMPRLPSARAGSSACWPSLRSSCRGRSHCVRTIPSLSVGEA